MRETRNGFSKFARWSGVLIVGIVWSHAGAQGAQAQGAPIPLTAELQVNQVTVGLQGDPAVGMSDSGTHIVVWVSIGQDGDGSSIVSRKFPADGTQPFSESVLNQVTAADQTTPDVSMNAGGDWVAIWDSSGSGQGLRGRASGFGGSTVGSEFQFSVSTSLALQAARVCRFDDDSYGGAWAFGTEAHFRLFSADGAALTADELAAPGLATSSRPAISFGADGSVILVAESADEDQKGIFGQRFDDAGLPVLDELQIPESPTNLQDNSDIDSAADGSFVVAWLDDVLGVRVRCFAAGAEPRSGEVEVSETASTKRPNIGVSPSGAFVVLYENGELRAREFDRLCRPVGEAFPVSSATTGLQSGGRAAAGADRFVLVWHTSELDGDSLAVARRMYRFRTIFAEDFESNDLSSWSLVAP